MLKSPPNDDLAALRRVGRPKTSVEIKLRKQRRNLKARTMIPWSMVNSICEAQISSLRNVDTPKWRSEFITAKLGCRVWGYLNQPYHQGRRRTTAIGHQFAAGVIGPSERFKVGIISTHYSVREERVSIPFASNNGFLISRTPKPKLAQRRNRTTAHRSIMPNRNSKTGWHIAQGDCTNHFIYPILILLRE